MPVHYALFENNLTSDPNDFSAVVQHGDPAGWPLEIMNWR